MVFQPSHLSVCDGIQQVWRNIFKIFVLYLCINSLGIGKVDININYLNYVMSLVYFFRFAYVRYASGLVKEGVNLLHQLAVIFFVIFCIKRNVTLYYAYLYKSIYKGAPKMLFCMKQNVTAALKEDYIGKSVKPKILLIGTCIIIIIALTHFFVSALKARYT